MIRLLEQDAVRLARSLYGLAAAARALPSERDQNFRLATERARSSSRSRAPPSARSSTSRTTRSRGSPRARPRCPCRASCRRRGRRRRRGPTGRLVRAADVPARHDPRRGEPPDAGAARRRRPLPRRARRGPRGLRASGGRGPRPALEPGPRARRDRAAPRRDPRPGAPGARRRTSSTQHARSVAPLSRAAARAASSTTTPTTTTCSSATPRRRPRRSPACSTSATCSKRWTVCELAVAIAYAHLRQGRSARRGRASRPATTRRPPPDRGRARGALELRGDPPLHERVPLGAPAHGRARQRLPHGQRGPGLGGARADARGPPAPGALPPARRLRPAACPQTPAIEAWLRGAPRRDRAGRRGGPLAAAVVFDLSVGSPVFATPEQTTDTAAMTAKLFGRDAREGRRARRSAATTRRGCSTRATRSRDPAASTPSGGPCTSRSTSSWSPDRPSSRPWPAGCTASATTPRAWTTARP